MQGKKWLLGAWLFISLLPSAQAALSFSTAIARAYQNNPDLQAQILEAEVARGAMIQSGLFPNPIIALEAENIGGSGDFKAIESAETTLSIVQDFPLGHQLKAAQQAKYAGYMQKITAIERKKAELYIQVGIAYVDLRYAKENMSLIKQLFSIEQDIVAKITEQLPQGMHSELDLAFAKIELGKAQTNLIQAELYLKQQKMLLGRLIGQKHPVSETLMDKGLPHKMLSWKQIKNRLTKSVFLDEKRMASRSRKQEIIAAKRQVYPTLSLQLGGRHFADDNQNAFVVSAASGLPIFNKKQGEIKSAEAQYTQSLEALRAQDLDLNAQLYALYWEAVLSKQAADNIEQVVLPLAKEAAKLAAEGYEKGRYQYLELAKAYSTVINKKREYQNYHAQKDKAIIQIYGYLFAAMKSVGEK